MKRLARFSLVALLTLATAALVGCAPEDPNSLANSDLIGGDPNGTAAGEKNTFNHIHEAIGGQNGITDLQLRAEDELAVGSPEEVAHLHGAQKISYVALGKMLTDLGTTTGGGAAAGGNKKGGTTTTTGTTAGALYSAGKNALGAPIFSSRTPEMTQPSTSALAKEYDIFIAGAPDIIANISKSTRCPGVALVTAGQLTQDGISCLMGKPATADHVTLANKLVADSGDATKGPEIAVATILAAAHISE